METEYSPPEQCIGQGELFEVRTFLGRTVLIIENVAYPQFTLEDDPDEAA